MSDSIQLLLELRGLKGSLTEAFRAGDWQALGRSLDSVIRLSQRAGHKELCLRAQSLRGIVADQRAGAGGSGSELLEDLLARLSHLEWLASDSATELAVASAAEVF